MNTVYLHRRNDTNEIFYVGIGNKQRPYDVHQRGRHWKRIVNKHGHSVEVIAEYADRELARQHEIIYIAGCRLEGMPIVNIAHGGDEAPSWKGRKQSKEHIRKRIETRQLKNNYAHTDETKEKLREAAIKQAAEGRNTGRPKGIPAWNKGKSNNNKEN